MNTIAKACVIGHPIAHSRSPMLHNYWLKQMGIAGHYEKLDVPPEMVGSFFSDFIANGFIGANVTVPHKQEAAKYVTRLDDAAKIIGAINTVWLENGNLVGGNTDSYGFIANLDDRAPGWDVPGGHAVLLGAGGAARAAIHGLRERGQAVHLFNRTREHADSLARYFGDGVSAHDMDELEPFLDKADVLVNVTSLGMVGKPANTLSLKRLKEDAVVYDVVYVPLETQLLREAALRGHRTVDGLGMLLHQGVMGFSKWFGKKPVITPALREMIAADIRATTPV